MKKLTLTVPELEQIEINGETFDVLMSDIDIINKSADYHKKYKNIGTTDIEKTRTAVNEAVGIIDNILGDGAVKRISQGRPVGMITITNWLTAISRAVSEKADEKIGDKYE